jgi:hypothetical protein
VLLATSAASAKTASGTVASSSVLAARASARKPELYLMQVEEKLLFVLNAPRRVSRSRPSWTCPWPPARGAAMESYRVVLSPSAKWTRVLLTHGPDELLRAILPPPSQVLRDRPVPTFLEGLAEWLDVRLPVVLSVGAQQVGSCLGLTDDLGVGRRCLYYEVEVRERGLRRRRGARIRGLGDFGDLRQLRLVADGEDR